jgi:NodT family efflux transporter outer membrane factor (OMF) lipoprotein
VLAGAALGVGVLVASGCTPLREYIHNGFKVGPNYCRPAVPVAEQWIDAADVRVRGEYGDDSHWWMAFNDPALNWLVQTAYQQNLTLREAGFRVLEARATFAIAVGSFFPQTQNLNGDYQRIAVSEEVANRQAIQERFYSQWDWAFNLAWELDFWGRFRRAIEASCANLDASVESYDDVLVTLVGDVAANYVQMRTLERQIAIVRANIELQKETLKIAQARFKGGQTSELDPDQAETDLYLYQAHIPQLEIQLREATNRLSILLGMPPMDLRKKLGPAPIPTPPAEVAVGIPCDLIRRRPDVRRAERQAAAQSAQIGVADAHLYPHISLIGQFGYSAEEFADLFSPQAFQGRVGPSFRWDVLNYGRLISVVKLADARFQELVVAYQNSVLRAGEEVENGLVRYLRSQEQVRYLQQSVRAAERSVRVVLAQYRAGLLPFNWVAMLQEQLLRRQLDLAQAQGQVALGLVQVYRALGGGWQIRCDPYATLPVPPPEAGTASEDLLLPAPRPVDLLPNGAAKPPEGQGS